MSWKPSESVDPGTAGAGTWLKWADGETKVVTVLNDQPVMHSLHWVNGRAQPCLESGCRACELGMANSQRYTVTVDCAGYETKWEMALLTWRDVAAIAEMQGTLRGLQLRVRRNGSGKQMRYTLIADGIVPGDQLEPEPVVEAAVDAGPALPDAGLVSGSFSRVSVVAADPLGAAAYAKDLAEGLGTTAKAVRNDLAATEGAAWYQRSATSQLHAVLLELEARSRAVTESVGVAADWELDDLLGI